MTYNPFLPPWLNAIIGVGNVAAANNTVNNSQQNKTSTTIQTGLVSGANGGFANWGRGTAEGTTTNNTNTTWGSQSTNAPTYDPLAGLKWEQAQAEAKQQAEYASAAATMRAAFDMYGLSSLNDIMTSYIMDGKPAAEVAILLRQTKAYQERFPAMSVLAKKGQAITEDSYIKLEQGYNTILQSAGLGGYFKSPNDYYHYIANDISTQEFGSRVNAATTMINNSNPNTVNAFKNYYGIGKTDLLKYYLDPEKAAPELLKKAEIASVGGSAAVAGIDIGESFARSIADAGVTKNAPEAFAKTAQTREELGTLSAISGADLTTKDIVSANLGMDVNAEKKVTGLASQERARFSGKGTGQSMIQQNVSGSY